MDFNYYQLRARETAIYPMIGDNLNYTLIGLTGENGELLNKFKKVIRDDKGVLSDEKKTEMRDELGDVLWYIAMTACELGSNLDDIATANLLKLSRRRHTGTISGSGDKRQDQF